MPDLTVIEGGGDPAHWDRDVSPAVLSGFRHCSVANACQWRAEGHLARRNNSSPSWSTPRKAKFRSVRCSMAPVKDLHERAFGTEGEAFYEIERKDIRQAALRVIAESMATDNAARARLSKREEESDPCNREHKR